jgi:CxxC motif-containing protein (DUF1111 family)
MGRQPATGPQHQRSRPPTIMALSSLPLSTLKGQCAASALSCASLQRLPRRRWGCHSTEPGSLSSLLRASSPKRALVPAGRRCRARDHLYSSAAGKQAGCCSSHVLYPVTCERGARGQRPAPQAVRDYLRLGGGADVRDAAAHSNMNISKRGRHSALVRGASRARRT